MLTLKKCPFCGGEPILCNDSGVFTYSYDLSIWCPGCGIELKKRFNTQENRTLSLEDVVRHISNIWNSRVKEE